MVCGIATNICCFFVARDLRKARLRDPGGGRLGGHRRAGGGAVPGQGEERGAYAGHRVRDDRGRDRFLWATEPTTRSPPPLLEVALTAAIRRGWRAAARAPATAPTRLLQGQPRAGVSDGGKSLAAAEARTELPCVVHLEVALTITLRRGRIAARVPDSPSAGSYRVNDVFECPMEVSSLAGRESRRGR